MECRVRSITRGSARVLGPLLVALWVTLPLVGGAQAGSMPDELELYQQRLQELFRQLDRDGDGRLDRDEARANAYLKRHFERLDRGDKGYLVPADLR